jgi:hypothetical protein
MPTLKSADLPTPQSWEELEVIVADLLQREWRDPNLHRNGRSGQSQQGVDIYGRREGKGSYLGCQVKDRESVTEPELRAEVSAAKSFAPPLGHYILAYAGPTDARLQEVARRITLEHEESALFSVNVWSWPDTCRRLTDYPELLESHYPQFHRAAASHKILWTVRNGGPQFRLSPGIHQGNLLCQFQITATEMPGGIQARWVGAGTEHDWSTPMRENRPGGFQMKGVPMSPMAPIDQVSFEIRFNLDDGPHGGRWTWPLRQREKGQWELEGHLGSHVFQPRDEDAW